MGVLRRWPQGGVPGLRAIVQHTGPEGQDSGTQAALWCGRGPGSCVILCTGSLA